MDNQIQDDEIDLKELIITLFKGWKIIVGVTLFVTLITFFYVRTLPNQYHVVTQAASIGSSGDPSSQMAGLAALAGMSMPTGGSDVNLLDYVEDVVKNGDFLDALLFELRDTTITYDTLESSVDTIIILSPQIERIWTLVNPIEVKTENSIDTLNSITLSQYFGIEIDTTQYQDEKFNFMLRRALYGNLRSTKKNVATIGFDAGVLSIETKFTDPQLSFDFHQRVLKQLRNYFQNDYTNRDAKKREFIEERVNEVEDSLRRAENRLGYYLGIHPALAQDPSKRTDYVSPKSIVEFGRRTRKVAQFNTMYVELLKQLEMAKIDEKKEQPIFEVVRKSEFPLGTSDPNRKLLLVIGFILGGALGIFVVFGKEWLLSFREEK